MFKSLYSGTNWEQQNSIYIPHKVKTPHESLPVPMKCHIGRTLILQGCLCCASQSDREDEPSPHVVCTPVLSPHRKVKKKQHIINKSQALEEDAIRRLQERKTCWAKPWQEGPGFQGEEREAGTEDPSPFGAEKEWRDRVSTFVLLIFEERHQPRSTVLFSRTSSFILLFSLFCSVPHSAERTASSCFLYLTFPPLCRLSSTPHSSLTLPRLPLQQQKSLPTRRG